VKATAAANHKRPDARSLAMKIVERVLFDDAYAAAALNAEFSRYPQLSLRERAFTTEIVYTVLRCRRAIEARLTNQAPRGLPKDRVVRGALLVAAAQALLLDHASVPIAVDAAVARVKELRGAKSAGFVNALLRRIAAQPPLSRVSALRDSIPGWLRAELIAAVGADETDALIGASDADIPVEHTIDIRLVMGRPVPDWLLDAPHGRWLSQARRVSKVGDPRSYPGWEEGDFTIQEEGAQLIAWALDVTVGTTVLDACAGRGQKTTLLAERIGPNGTLWSTDLYAAKLEALQAELTRLHLSNVQTQALDWSVGGGTIPNDFEFVLVDAPCTGTGTMIRRPEILERLQPTDPGRMGELATQILRNVAKHTRSGGKVVYAVCSVLPQEGEAVLAQVADIFEPTPFTTEALCSAFGTEVSQGRLLPLRHGTDGYFVAQLRKR